MGDQIKTAAANGSGCFVLRFNLREEDDDQLSSEYHRDQRNGIGGCIGGSHIFGAGDVNEGSQSGGGGICCYSSWYKAFL